MISFVFPTAYAQESNSLIKKKKLVNLPDLEFREEKKLIKLNYGLGGLFFEEEGDEQKGICLNSSSSTIQKQFYGSLILLLKKQRAKNQKGSYERFLKKCDFSNFPF